CQGECSDCARLSEAGALFVSKKCIEKDPAGGCAVWEKTYDLGKKKPTRRRERTFLEGKKIVGLNGEFRRPSEKSSDFANTRAVFSVLADLDKGGGLFPGEPLRCRCAVSD